jgi:AcrR family transcriptional regulator
LSLPATIAIVLDVGLRERKKERTRDRLVAEALRLFSERGYEGTSIEEIAAAADVSPRTFFRYFPTKADVVFADLPARIEAVRDALAADRFVHDALREVVEHSLDYLGDPELLAMRNRLVLANPPLRARLLEFIFEVETMVTSAYARERVDPLVARLAAAITAGSARAALVTWTMDDGDLREIVRRSFAATAPGVRRVLRAG